MFYFMQRRAGVLCVTLWALAWAVVALVGLSGCTPAPYPPSFELRAYYAQGGALHSEALDSGLSAADCAFALQSVYRDSNQAESELVTCTPEGL